MRIDKVALAAALDKMAKGLDFATQGPCASQAEAEMAMGIGRLAKMAQEYLHLIPADTDDPPEAPTPGIPWGDVKWLDVPDVMSWKRVSPLRVTLSGEFIQFSFKTPNWPDKDCYGEMVYANPWVIARIGDEWLGATFEWLRRASSGKNKASVAASHIKRKDFPADWRPTSGERLGFLVTSLARAGARTVNERTDPVEVTWYA